MTTPHPISICRAGDHTWPDAPRAFERRSPRSHRKTPASTPRHPWGGHALHGALARYRRLRWRKASIGLATHQIAFPEVPNVPRCVLVPAAQ